MRDISISSLDKNGLANFSIKNIQLVSGIQLLVAKATKKVLSQTTSNYLFKYYGLDIEELAYTGISNKTISDIKALLSTKLQNIESSIKDNTLSEANPEDRLAALTLEDIIYDKKNHKIILSLKVFPIKGDPKSLLFPLDK